MQPVLVFFEDDGQLRHLRIGRILVEILRSFFLILRLADARQRRAVLHELLVEPERPEHCLMIDS